MRADPLLPERTSTAATRPPRRSAAIRAAVMAMLLAILTPALDGWAAEALDDGDATRPAADAIATLLDAFHDAAARADGDAYFDLLTPDAVFLGTDPGERWSKSAFKAYARPYFDRGTGWRYDVVERRIDVQAGGELAWFDEDLTNAKYGACRGTGIVRREAAGWRIVRYALALSIPNEHATAVVDLIRSSERDVASPDEAAVPLPPLPPRRPSWMAVDAGTTAGLRGVSVPDGGTAWITGTDRTVRRTTDSGRTWTAHPIPDAIAAELDYRDVHAFDEHTAVIMAAGPVGRILRTEDGGATWGVVLADDRPGVFLDGLAFWDDRHGIAYGDPVDGAIHLILTDDGGRTWTNVPTSKSPPARPGEAGFAASGTGVAVYTAPDGARHAWIGLGGRTDGGPARLLRTTDGGASWTAYDSPLPASPSAGIFSVHVISASQAVIVGGDYLDPDATTGVAAYTTTGGRLWQPVEADVGPRGYRSVVCAILPIDGLIAAGINGSEWSSDRGRTWHPIDDQELNAVAASPDGVLVVGVGPDGRVVIFKLP